LRPRGGGGSHHPLRLNRLDGWEHDSEEPETIRYVNVPPEDARKARLAAGVPPFLIDALDELFAERRKGKEAEVYPEVATVFGLQATTFATFAARHAAIFRGEQQPPRV
jgi:hypothetical protein